MTDYEQLTAEELAAMDRTERSAYYMALYRQELQRTPYEPVKPFDNAAEAEQFHADIAAWLQEGKV